MLIHKDSIDDATKLIVIEHRGEKVPFELLGYSRHKSNESVTRIFRISMRIGNGVNLLVAVMNSILSLMLTKISQQRYLKYVIQKCNIRHWLNR